MFACQLNALDGVERQRQQVLLDRARRAALAAHELPDGVAVRFPADPALFLELAEWIGLERRCCPFLGFALEWNEDDRVSVRLTGPPGIKEFLAQLGLAVRP